MRKIIATAFIGATMASPMALAERSLDPIFQVMPVSGQPDSSCFENTRDNRNVVVRGATSTAGQTVIGGLIGAAVGNRFGGGSGRDIATGVGAAAGAAAGAWNANRMEQQRIRECQQYQDYANQGGGYSTDSGGSNYGSVSSGNSGYTGASPNYASGFTSSQGGGGYVTNYNGR